MRNDCILEGFAALISKNLDDLCQKKCYIHNNVRLIRVMNVLPELKKNEIEILIRKTRSLSILVKRYIIMLYQNLHF